MKVRLRCLGDVTQQHCGKSGSESSKGPEQLQVLMTTGSTLPRPGDVRPGFTEYTNESGLK